MQACCRDVVLVGFAGHLHFLPAPTLLTPHSRASASLFAVHFSTHPRVTAASYLTHATCLLLDARGPVFPSALSLPSVARGPGPQAVASTSCSTWWWAPARVPCWRWGWACCTSALTSARPYTPAWETRCSTRWVAEPVARTSCPAPRQLQPRPQPPDSGCQELDYVCYILPAFNLVRPAYRSYICQFLPHHAPSRVLGVPIRPCTPSNSLCTCMPLSPPHTLAPCSPPSYTPAGCH